MFNLKTKIFMEEKKCLSSQFIASQKAIILSRIEKYTDRKRISEELQEGDISAYILYKQEQVVPQLRKAISLIENGTYGTCLSCGGQIEMARLLQVPAAFSCIKCLNKKSF